MTGGEGEERAHAQHDVKNEAVSFVRDMCSGADAPTDVVIVYVKPSGEFGYCAPSAGSVVKRAGMLIAAQHQMLAQAMKGGE